MQSPNIVSRIAAAESRTKIIVNICLTIRNRSVHDRELFLGDGQPELCDRGGGGAIATAVTEPPALWYGCGVMGTIFFSCNIPFASIASSHFSRAIEKTKRTPNYTPAHRVTLSGSHLNKLSDKADLWKTSRLNDFLDYGFTLTGDGYKSRKNLKYNNFIIITAAGPVYLGLRDVTGHAATGEATPEEFSEVIASLEEPHQKAIILRITDTPSANRAAWKLLMAAHERQFWIGCMAHEVSLLMGDIGRLDFTKRLRVACMKLHKWVMNHSFIFAVFQKKVEAHFTAKMARAKTTQERKACSNRKDIMVLYKPGDTRMLSVFKLFFRIIMHMSPLIAMFNDADYKVAAQKAMISYNSTTKKRGKKFKKRGRGSELIDPLADLFGSEQAPLWKEMELWLKANVSIVYLHRTVDTHLPSLHLVYYCSCLVDKHLRVLSELDTDATWLESIKDAFMTRWYRWHRAVHMCTAAYHCNPLFQSHKMTLDEANDPNPSPNPNPNPNLVQRIRLPNHFQENLARRCG